MRSCDAWLASAHDHRRVNRVLQELRRLSLRVPQRRRRRPPKSGRGGRLPRIPSRKSESARPTRRRPLMLQRCSCERRLNVRLLCGRLR